MAWLIVDSGQSAVNTDHVVEFTVTRREDACAVTASLITGKPRMIRTCKSFAEAEGLLGKLAAVIALADNGNGNACLRVVGTEIRR